MSGPLGRARTAMPRRSSRRSPSSLPSASRSRSLRSANRAAPRRDQARYRPKAREDDMACAALPARVFDGRTRSLFIAQSMKIGNEIPHMGVVDRPLRLGFPGGVRAVVVGEHANDMDVVDIAELGAWRIDKFAAEIQVQALGHGGTPRV